MAIAVEEADVASAPVRARSGGLWRYILVRLVLIIPTVFILVTTVFFLMRMTGDPITAALGGKLPPAQLAERIHEAGYDRPLIVQYLDYLSGVFRGDFGTTLTDNRPVSQILLQYGSATLELAFYALIVAFLLGIPFGLIAAYKRDRWQDALLRVGAILGYATPIFFIAILLKLVFAVQINILPVSGRASTRVELALQSLPHPTGIYLIDAFQLGSADAVLDVLWHAVLPGLALGILTAGIFLRLVRINVIGTLEAQYVTSARSRGVGERRLVTKHAYRPALIPVVTLMGLQIAALLSGAVLTETSFEWKGLGFMLADYLKARDFVAVQGIVIMIAVVVAVANFIVDVIAVTIDPRVRY
ncbi:ABC transporter permease [Microbacterium kribbense]|uniref:ABC transporter permease n=1 Tax=Microbacterium kribbense TaxID=433645 RepID=A0ABP7G0N4_9MICO